MTKALTLHQPWAHLVAVGAKTIETRSWPTSYRGRLLIHSGASTKSWREMDAPSLMSERTTCTAVLNAFGLIAADGSWPSDWIDPEPPDPAIRFGWDFMLPLGAVVASCTLADCVPIVDDGSARNCVDVRPGHPEAGVALRLDEPLETNDRGTPIPVRPQDRAERIVDVLDQLPFGDFSPGRWAWLLEDVKPTTERCPACWGKGSICAYKGTECVQPGCIYTDPCGVCGGAGKCDPIPARGKQRLWEWAP